MGSELQGRRVLHALPSSKIENRPLIAYLGFAISYISGGARFFPFVTFPLQAKWPSAPRGPSLSSQIATATVDPISNVWIIFLCGDSVSFL